MREHDDHRGGQRNNLDQRLVRARMRQERRLKTTPSQQQRPGASSYAGRANTPRRPKRSRRSHRAGVVVISILLVGFASLLVYQLYQIQIVGHEEYVLQAAKQHYKKETEYPRRGNILDRNGVELAGTTYVYRIGITPKDMRSITKDISSDEIAASIAQCLELETSVVRAEMAKTDMNYIQLKKDVPREQADNLNAYLDENEIGGVRVDAEPRRYYTNGTLASQLIGYTIFSDQNLIGQLGVELEYNTLLTGEPGYTYVETDNYGSKGQLPFSVPTSLRAKDGQNLILNIDINIQKIIQEELESAINTYDITSGGTAIIMDPYTGAVLAMASYPYFSSSDPAACPEGQDSESWDSSQKESIDYLTSQIWRNRAISDTYEPGSTMKAITASMALEEALVKESDIMSDAPLSLADWTIRCSHGSHGTETMEQGFWRSCNPIFAQLALRVGVSRFYDYMRAFGFMGGTGIDLPGEGTGILHQNPTEIDMATLSYGESSTVTPIQLISAYCVFANGGNLVQPQIVKAVTDNEGAIIKEYQPETIRKVISESTSARIRELMRGVVLSGTGSAAYVEGYAIAGKTSTSTDDFGDHTLSFCGLAPADNPEIVALVVLNKPSDKELSSKVSAKLCGTMIERTLEYMGVSRVYTDKDVSNLSKVYSVPELQGLTYSAASEKLLALGLKAEAGDTAMGDNTVVKYQWPAASTELHKSGIVVLYPVGTPAEDLMTVPDFTGRNVSECLSLAAENGLNIKISGDCLGLAVSQDPSPTFGSATPTPTPTTSATDAGGETTPTQAGGQRIKRGSVVTITYVAIEEAVAQPDDSE